MAPNQETPDPKTQEQAGIHQDREAQPKHQQQTPPRGEPLSEADRDRGSPKTPPPASRPRE